LPWASWNKSAARASCFRLLTQLARQAAARAFWMAGRIRARSTTMRAITTSSSTWLKPRLFDRWDWNIGTPLFVFTASDDLLFPARFLVPQVLVPALAPPGAAVAAARGQAPAVRAECQRID